jgi:hypothetical protein
MTSTVRVCSAFLLAAVAGVILAGCSNGSATASGTSSGASTTPGTESNGLTISGIPALAVAAGSRYAFRPTASDIGAAALTFAVKNQPAWLQFDAATGALSGTPNAANIGSYSQIQITVSNGTATSALPAFSINVAQAGSASALAISGDPASDAVAGSAYSFRPTVTAPAGAVLAYSVKNLPRWAAFDPKTGTLSGTPAALDAGNSALISITVSDGAAVAALAGFSIQVASATSGVADLSWLAPQSTGSGSTELVGYHLYYGPNSSDLTHVVNITNPDSTSFVIDNLSSGTWYFAIKSYDARNVESDLSAIVAVPI